MAAGLSILKRWQGVWQAVTRVEIEKIVPTIALRNAIGVATPLAVAVAAGDAGGGVVAATGALIVSFSDSHEAYIVRARRMLAACFVVALGVFTGSVAGSYNPGAIAIATLWAFCAGMLVALSQDAADLGIVSLVMIVVFAAQPLSPLHALYAALLALAGGLLQTMLALLLWPLRRYEPEQRAMANLYLELSRIAAGQIKSEEAQPASMAAASAQNSLKGLGRDHTVHADRLRSLLNQAERMRLALLILARIRTRIARESPAALEIGVLDRISGAAANILSGIAHSLTSSAQIDPRPLDEIARLTDSLPQAVQGNSQLNALMTDARHQADALAGQLRAAVDLASYSTPSGLDAFRKREAQRPWFLRLRGFIATIRANLNSRSAAFRHAVRLAICVLAGDTIARSLHLQRSYWLVMTVAIVLKPDFTSTFSRGALRLIGTIAGLVLATGVFHSITPSLALQMLLLTLTVFLLRCFGPANYGIFSAFVTALVVLLFAIAGVSPREVIGARGVNTAIGGAIALLAYALWPTWEKMQAAETLARMLDTYREYFRMIHQAYKRPESSFAHELDRLRMAARLARSNVEASADRLALEAGVPARMTTALNAILASSHRLIHAMMALEGGLSHSRPVLIREASETFARNVELTLYYLASFLRGSPLSAKDLPDLRASHNALIEEGDPRTERYALVNVETDRITNSLNTLSEQVLSWKA